METISVDDKLTNSFTKENNSNGSKETDRVTPSKLSFHSSQDSCDFSIGCDNNDVFNSPTSDFIQILPYTKRQERNNTITLPAENCAKKMCSNGLCHCQACCSCRPDKYMKMTRDSCNSLIVNIPRIDKYARNDSVSKDLICSSPTPISSWGHYSKSRNFNYKYIRSDCSSDSDEEFLSKRSQKHWKSNILLQNNQDPLCSLNVPHGGSCRNPVDIKVSLHSQPKTVSDLAEERKYENPQTFEKSEDELSGCDVSRADMNDFRENCQITSDWFRRLSDRHRNIVLQHLLSVCHIPQIHLLSVSLENRLHSGCPDNCEDIISWIPSFISMKIFTFLDPVSLCQASLVCKQWYGMSNDASLWRRFCYHPKWRLSKPAEHKQVVRHMIDGSIQWKRVFAERFRLRRNWLTGRSSVRTFEGHTQGISCVQFDDTRIVSGSSDKTIKVWNIRTNASWSVQTLVGHSGTVRCLHLEGSKLVSGSTDRSIKVWDLSTEESWSSITCKVTMIGHSDTVRCLHVDDDKVISGSYDKTLKIWDLKTGICRNTLRGHLAAVLCVYFNDTKIVSGSCDKTIKVWNYKQCLMTLDGHRDAVTCLQFDATRIISGSLDCTLKFWDLYTGRCINTIDWRDSEGHTGVIRCLQADSWRLVSAADDKTLKVWNLDTGERLVTLRNHTDGVTCMQFNDFVIVSGSYDKTVKLWDFSCC